MQQDTGGSAAMSFKHRDAGHGAQWWGSAWQLLFKRGATGVWIAMCLIAIFMLAASHFIPVLGSLAAQVGAFVFAGGLMLAARRTDEGTPPEVGALFEGFGPELGQLAIGALLVLAGMLLVVAILALAGIGTMLGALAGALMGGGTAGVALVLAGVGITGASMILAALLLLVPIGMAAWLAPALIVLQHRSAYDALRLSLSACWANLGALTVYGLLWMGLSVLAAVTFMLGWLLLAPLMALSTYAAYKDLFEQSGAMDGPPRLTT